MDRKFYESYGKNCLMGGKAPCVCGCPLNLDILKMVDFVQKGNFTSAYKTFRDLSVFPGIVSRICPQPCKGACVRKDKDDSVLIRDIERACVEYTENDKPTRFNFPRRNLNVAVIGGGLAGLTCAHKLGTRGCDVTIYEKESVLGGRLHSMLEPEIFLKEFELQLSAARYKVEYNREIKSLDEIEYDVLFIATGEGGNDFGLREGMNEQSFGTKKDGVFMGGAILGAGPVADMGQAVVASYSMDKYLKIKKMDGTPESFMQTKSCIEKNMDDLDEIKMVPVDEGGIYSKENAVKEAERCLKCDCTECRDACELFDHFKKSPTLIVSDGVTSLHSRAGISRQTTTQVISACNLCGLCKKVCPRDIDIGMVAHDFRHFKMQDDYYPKGYSDFFIRDMNYSNTAGYLARTAPGYDKASYMFFPGCQLGASNPEYVGKSYEYLLSKIPDTAIMLGCCGAPADWGGEGELNKQVIDNIRETWEKFGKPTLICACATCMKQFEEFLPEVEKVSLYEIIEKYGAEAEETFSEKMSVFDPCASREYTEMQKSVRAIAAGSGIEIDELKYSNEKARCCGWGGHVMGANRKFADEIIENRISQSDNPYVTYCTKCRDTFAWKGKDCLHILAVIFGINDRGYVPPSPCEKRANKVKTKNLILNGVFGEETEEVKEGYDDMNLIISDELKAKLSHSLILEDETYETIKYIEKTGNRLYNKDNDSYIGYFQIGIVTYWVEYKKVGDDIVLLNAYSHRVKIDETKI